MVSNAKTAARIESVADARYFAEKRVPKGIFQSMYLSDGSKSTAALNVRAFEEVLFRPRGAVFHPALELRTRVLGHEIALPVILSSVGGLGVVAHRHGEAGVARAAGAAGTIMFVSGLTTTPIEEIMAAANGPIFYQLYYMGGREASAPIIERVKRAGVSGLVLTVDTAAAGKGATTIPYRDRAYRPASFGLREMLRFAPQALARPAWLLDYLRSGTREPKAAMALRPDGTPMSAIEGLAKIFDEAPVWEDLPWIRERWDGPLVIKGIVTVEDARRAVDAGVDAIVVSNHGGNHLDDTVPTLRVLPEIVDAVGDRVEVLVDGGVRRGIDVVKALALGAKAVGVGRAYVYPLMAAGEPGVRRILDVFVQQMEYALGSLGVASVHDLDPSYVELPASWARTPLGASV